MNAELEAARAQLNETSAALDRANAAAKAEAAHAATELEEVLTKLANCEAQVEMVQGIVPEPDDLRRIEGIGPKVSGVLTAAGILTFAQLASYTPSDLRRVLKDGGMSRINDPETWPEQAALAAAGRWTELDTLQDELIGGRRVK